MLVRQPGCSPSAQAVQIDYAVPNAGLGFAWHPSAQRLAVLSGRQVLVCSKAGKVLQRISLEGAGSLVLWQQDTPCLTWDAMGGQLRVRMDAITAVVLACACSRADYSSAAQRIQAAHLEMPRAAQVICLIHFWIVAGIGYCLILLLVAAIHLLVAACLPLLLVAATVDGVRICYRWCARQLKRRRSN